MKLFDMIAEMGHEQLVLCNDNASGYRGIIAVHSTTLGPALGGTRFWNYATDEEAIVDALRLARGMTYKNAMAGLNLGGGKSVIIGDNKTTDREMIFRAHGRFVESLGGRYITAEDVGTSTADMDYVHMETDYVSGLAGRSGDPSPVTAHGVFRAIQAAAKDRWGSDDLSNRTVAVQGCGHVGYYLSKELHETGAKLIVTDIDAERVKRAVSEFAARAVAPDEIYSVQADIFAPVRAWRHHQRQDDSSASSGNRGRRGEQSIARGAPWRRARVASHHVRARLRGECRGRDQRVQRAGRLDVGAVVPKGRRDLLYNSQGLRDREDRADSYVSGR
jgi:leucine dehydrogenase